MENSLVHIFDYNREAIFLSTFLILFAIHSLFSYIKYRYPLVEKIIFPYIHKKDFSFNKGLQKYITI